MRSRDGSNDESATNSSNNNTATTSIANSTNSNSDKIDNLGNINLFAQEIGCSPSQAADYACEIDDALQSVGLLLPSETTGAITDSHEELLCNTKETALGVMSPPSSLFPATAASLLSSKSSSHHGHTHVENNNSNNSNSNNKNGNPNPQTNHQSTTTTARQIVSFSKPLDALLGGGIALSELTEIVGLPGSGKTQLAMQLCVDARLPGKYGGVEGCAVVIDSEGSWGGFHGSAGMERCWDMAVALVEHVRSSALRKMEARRAREEDKEGGGGGGGGGAVGSSSRLGGRSEEEELASLVPCWFTPQSILEGIHIFRVHDEASQTCTMYNLPQFLLEQEEKGTPVKIVVVDSVAFHYRMTNSSSTSTAPSQSSLSFTNKNNNGKHIISKGGKSTNSFSNTHNITRIATLLTEIASEFDVAVVAMNHLTTKMDIDNNNPGTSSGGTKLVPALGESWAHAVSSRLMIDHLHRLCPESSAPMDDTMEDIRVCTLVKSPHKPPGTAQFVITDKGIRGVPPRDISRAQKRARLD